MPALDIGSPAIDRALGSTTQNTYILTENPANVSGKLTQIEVYLINAITNLRIYIVYQVAANTFTARSVQDLGPVAAGYHALAVDLAVEVGDYICWVGFPQELAPQKMEADITGSGYWYYPGCPSPFTNVLFTFTAARTQSLYGTGVALGGGGGGKGDSLMRRLLGVG